MKLLSTQEIILPEIDLSLRGTSPDPRFRRATANMTMTTLCCEHLLKALPAQTSKQDVSMVLATHFGEVGSTLDFLRTSPSSPTLFQNSLHNSTLGFASVTLGLTGPGMTISCDSETYSSSLLMAETLLNMTPFVLVVFVDSVPKPLENLYIEVHPYVEKFLNKATGFLFSKTEGFVR
jgi:hypothetical protein